MTSRLATACVLTVATSSATAAIVPSWRVDPINGAAMQADPLLTHAISLTGPASGASDR